MTKIPNDIENEKWISVKIMHDADKSNLDKTKKYFQEMAKLLDWKFSADIKPTDGKYSVAIFPEGENYSPIELKDNFEKILKAIHYIRKKLSKSNPISPKGGTAFSFVSETDLRPKLEPSKEKRQERLMGKVFSGCLYLDFKMINRILLEEKNFELANFIFRSSLYLDFEYANVFKRLFYKLPYFEQQNRLRVRKQHRAMCGLD